MLQISFVASTLPFALTAPGFPLRSLAAQASRASLGGPRELLLGVLQAARLVDGAAGAPRLPEAQRRLRAVAARAWLAALAIPAPARLAIARTFDASAEDDRATLAEAWGAVVQLAAPHLDPAARTEVRRITTLIHPGT